MSDVNMRIKHEDNLHKLVQSINIILKPMDIVATAVKYNDTDEYVIRFDLAYRSELPVLSGLEAATDEDIRVMTADTLIHMKEYFAATLNEGAMGIVNYINDYIQVEGHKEIIARGTEIIEKVKADR